MTDIETLLDFWFEETSAEKLFARDDSFDAAIRDRFGALTERAAAGAFADWGRTARGSVALCLLLDQFPRNLHRGTPRAFATDPMARAVARNAIESKLDLSLDLTDRHRVFLYLPFEHSEDLWDQLMCVGLFRARIEDQDFMQYALGHLAIIQRFGRFPHRNEALGRTTTTEEAAFLKTPGSSY